VFNLSTKSGQFATLTILGITWGSSFILMKQGLVMFSGIQVAAMRLGFACLALLPWFLPKWKSIPAASWPWLILTGLLGSAIPAFLFAIGISKIDSSLAGIINATAPLFTLLVGMLLFKMRVGKWGILGILTGLIGTSYLILSQKNIQTDAAMPFYALMPLLGAVCYGFSTNLIKNKLQHLDAITITGASLLMGGIPGLLGLAFTGTFQEMVSSEAHMKATGFLILLGVVGTSIAVIVFNHLIRYTSVLFAASVTYLIPFFALIWGWALGESITLHTFLGMGIILAGVAIVNRDKP
jgi:drug/metabolite transporter (DMT)-like permease